MTRPSTIDQPATRGFGCGSSGITVHRTLDTRRARGVLHRPGSRRLWRRARVRELPTTEHVLRADRVLADHPLSSAVAVAVEWFAHPMVVGLLLVAHLASRGSRHRRAL